MYLNNHKAILLLEDDLIDVMTVRRALEDLKIRNRLIIQSNGVEGLNFLNQSRELPGIILLDLNMPKMNGLEFLKSIQTGYALSANTCDCPDHFQGTAR